MPKVKAAPLAWQQEQERISKLRDPHDCLDWTVDADGNIDGLHMVAGLDISRFPEAAHAVAAVVVLSFPDLEVLHTRCVTVQTSVPYIPNYLAFREAPPLAALIEGLPKRFRPQLVFVDGNGAFHPRRCGVATHLGVACGIPTVGIAKKLLRVGNITTSYASCVAAKLRGPGDWLPLSQPCDGGKEEGEMVATDDAGRLAAVLLPGRGASPLIVSPGHRISLRSAATVAAAVCQWRKVAEPIYQADLISRIAVREWLAGKELPSLVLGEPRRELDAKGRGVLPVVDKLIQRRQADQSQPDNKKAVVHSKERSGGKRCRWVPVQKSSSQSADSSAASVETDASAADGRSSSPSSGSSAEMTDEQPGPASLAPTVGPSYWWSWATELLCCLGRR
mmetsp:Transcript_11914/g.27798  ORF Transcript_11914/g.27798 Transcript_11914/m.27798 type:complete len:392 (+) Transcript_11914:93-1268(+)